MRVIKATGVSLCKLCTKDTYAGHSSKLSSAAAATAVAAAAVEHAAHVLFQVTRNPLDPLRHTLYYLRADDVIHEETPSQVLQDYYNTTDPLHRRASTARLGSGGDGMVAHPLARKTIQVAGARCM
jgi:hypothetical protein